MFSSDVIVVVYLLLTNLFYFRYTAFGTPVPHRPVQDMAFAVAKFIQKGGSFVNYYMVKKPKELDEKLNIFFSVFSLNLSFLYWCSTMEEQTLVGQLVVHL